VLGTRQPEGEQHGDGGEPGRPSTSTATYKPIPEERVLEIVDDLFMPLIAAARDTSGR
jgi:hypothetical protein